MLRITNPDGTHKDNTYAGDFSTTYDEMSKWRTFQTDALGRLVWVNEPKEDTGVSTTYWTS